jgi:type II secretory ATPase GspE/PulE/Tfp pilus assembly ATPase PilB-like protein
MAEISKITGEIKLEKISEIEKINNLLEFKEKIEKNLNATVTEISEIIFGGAINLGSSDIHFEPKEDECRLRIRIDGILEDVTLFSKKIYEGILSRIKLLSGLKLNVTDRPQDGRFSIFLKENEKPIEIRVSSLPSEYGEAIVARILNPKSLISLEELGLREDLLKTFRKEIKKPNGMIIVTGPTGSGKTTTLYAFLREINRPELKIITIEDPIEYKLEGIQQTQVDPVHGYDFANGLKSIMRQDPDVILVGEIRDLETAQISLQAALTGHLVFSTLHTNDAAGTIARLIALGEKPVNIAPAINMVIAQRLVRRVCKNCSKLEEPTKEERMKIENSLKNIPKSVKVPKFEKIPRKVGCKNCNFTGYRGRIGIFEAFLIDDEMENFILKEPSISALREMAIKKGMITMYQDGILKALEGITTTEEVERVVSE